MWKAGKSKQVWGPKPRYRPIWIQDLPETSFDYETGQQYTETQVPVASKRAIDWIGEFKTPKLVRPIERKEEGTQRLFTIAVGAVVKQLRALDAQHFSSIPWDAAKVIWDEVVARYLDWNPTVHHSDRL
jgi:hypothetical protein